MRQPGPGWPTRGGQKAVFLDRDGTLIEDADYLGDASRVVLLPGVVAGLRRLRDAGYGLAIVTNQSGVGRGMITEEDVVACQDRLDGLLAEEGIELVASGWSTMAPGTENRRVVEHFMRKPGPGIVIEIARAHGLDTTRSWMIGDAERDLIAGRDGGCCGTILIDTGQKLERDGADLVATERVSSFSAAVDRVLRSAG
ncbi:MAG: HAD-IIIA family hydrolase [Phycisphaeraceae bacterium]